MKTKIKKLLFEIIGFVALIGTTISLLVGLIYLDKKEFQNCIDNPLTINEVEEELEYIFMTIFVVVNESEQEEDEIYYDVEANDLNYRVRYKIEHYYPSNYGWEYQSHIQIG